MCLSPATLNVRKARELEWETLSSDEEDELPSSWTGLGLPAMYLDSNETDDSPRTSGSTEAALFPHFTQAHRLAAEVDHQLKQLQLVGAGCRPCLASIQKPNLKNVPCWLFVVGADSASDREA